MTSLECVFRIVHAGTGYTQTYRIRGRRTNDSDKGVSQAISSASKSFFQYVCQVREDEDPDALWAEDPATGQTTTRAGRGPKRSQVPTPAEAPPEKLHIKEEMTLTPAKRLELAKEDIKASLKREHLRIYHLEAFAQITPALNDDIKEWHLPDYELVQKVMKENPTAFVNALKEASKKYPSSADRIEKLRGLQSRLDGDEQRIASDERILIASACLSNNSDAVEYWTDRLSSALRGQQEADV